MSQSSNESDDLARAVEIIESLSKFLGQWVESYKHFDDWPDERAALADAKAFVAHVRSSRVQIEVGWCKVCGELTCEDPQACDGQRAQEMRDSPTHDEFGALVRRLFTFGFGQTDPRTGASLSNRYVWVEGRDREHCREQMLERFGRAHHRPVPEGGGNWAFDYPSEDAAGVARYRMIEIDFDTGRDQ